MVVGTLPSPSAAGTGPAVPVSWFHYSTVIAHTGPARKGFGVIT
jgi:hypothetical protein